MNAFTIRDSIYNIFARLPEWLLRFRYRFVTLLFSAPCFFNGHRFAYCHPLLGGDFFSFIRIAIVNVASSIECFLRFGLVCLCLQFFVRSTGCFSFLRFQIWEILLFRVFRRRHHSSFHTQIKLGGDFIWKIISLLFSFFFSSMIRQRRSLYNEYLVGNCEGIVSAFKILSLDNCEITFAF